jgi:hypothetical protein
VKTERSDVKFPLWRKKVDSSLFNHKGTTIPNWACRSWRIEKQFFEINSKKDSRSKVIILFVNKTYEGWVTEAKQGRVSPAYRLWFSDDLLNKIKDIFLMSYMRDIENRLRGDEETNIEDEIPFWEFLDIEYDAANKKFFFKAYYTQKPSFPELFKRLIGSPALRKIDAELAEKTDDRIFKQDWRPRKDYKAELGAENVVYMLVDTKSKLFYVGEAQNLIKRFSQGHKVISEWDYYRYDVLPDSLAEHRLGIERMEIRSFASLLKCASKEDMTRMDISGYTLVNEKVDK